MLTVVIVYSVDKGGFPLTVQDKTEFYILYLLIFIELLTEQRLSNMYFLHDYIVTFWPLEKYSLTLN